MLTKKEVRRRVLAGRLPAAVGVWEIRGAGRNECTPRTEPKVIAVVSGSLVRAIDFATNQQNWRTFHTAGTFGTIKEWAPPTVIPLFETNADETSAPAEVERMRGTGQQGLTEPLTTAATKGPTP